MTVATADRRLRVLVVDRMPPTSLTQGNALIGRNLFPRLRQHHLTLVAPAVPDERADAEAALAGVFDEVHLVDTPAIPPALGGWFDATMPGSRSSAAEGIRGVLASLRGRGPFDVAHVRQLPMAPFGRRVDAAGRLLELIDSETLATRRDPSTGGRHLVRRHLAREVERRAIRGFDVVTTVADADAAALRALASGTRIEVVPNGVDADVYAPLDLPETPDSIAFLGAMSFPPNVAAVRWFADDVLPAVQARRPGATFTIIGRDPSDEVLQLARRPGIEVTGTVADVRPHLARAAVVVCPMISGSGIKNKALEALAMARPLVATPMAVEAIDATLGRDVEVASSAAALADAVLRLLADPVARRALGSNGRRLVERRYSWDACAARYDALYRELARRAVAGRRSVVTR